MRGCEAECCELICQDPVIYRIRLPFVNLGGGVSNCYLLRDGDEWLLVDSGAQGLRNKRILVRAMCAVGFDAGHATAFLTHAHFDHADLMPDVLGFSTPLLLSGIDYHRQSRRNNELQRLFVRRMRAMGSSLDDACSYAAANAEAAVLDPRSLAMRYVGEGDTFRVGSLKFRVVATPGHTADHLSLFEDASGILFSGDAVLEDTAPSLDCQPGVEDGLSTYLASLERIRGLEVSYALPGHGDPLRGMMDGSDLVMAHESKVSLEQAIEANVSKKISKLKRVANAVSAAPFASGQQIARLLLRCDDYGEWRKLEAMPRYYALLEAFMMLQHLVMEGRVIRMVDDYGVYRYAISRRTFPAGRS